jgi:hypothetical protein
MSKCFHDPASPWAYAAHRRRGTPQCKDSLKAWAKYIKGRRIDRGITKNRLVPIKRNTK